MKRNIYFLVFSIVFLVVYSLAIAQYSEISFPIASSEFANGNPTDYTMGVGDVNGDGKEDIIINTWVREPDKSMFAYTLAYTVEGAGKGNKIWQFDNKIDWQKGKFRRWIAVNPMTVWDFDNDGCDEVISIEGNDLIMLDYEDNALKIKYRKHLVGLDGYLLSTVAFLQGRNKEPFIIIAYGKMSKVIALYKDFTEYKKFDNPDYYEHYPHNVYIRGFDFDRDGKDEIIYGAILLDENLEIYIDGTDFVKSDRKGMGRRSYIADIDPDNPGYEWFFIRSNGFQTTNDPEYHWKPTRWEGPYLVDVDQKKLLWHHDGSQQGWLGWGDNHRGWVGDVLPDIPGLEMYVSGVLWESQKQWQDSLNYGYLNYHNLMESDMIFDCKGNIHNLRLHQGHRAVYPVAWDDDPEAEIFNYRSGELSDGFPPDSKIASLKGQTALGGECTITDFLGDWREEIIVVADHIVHVYSNSEPTKFPNRLLLRECHNYRIHQASIGGGLPKPYQPDIGWPESIIP